MEQSNVDKLKNKADQGKHEAAQWGERAGHEANKAKHEGEKHADNAAQTASEAKDKTGNVLQDAWDKTKETFGAGKK